MNVERRDARPTAVVRKRTTWAGFPSEWRPMLDEVSAFVRAGGVQQHGHNVMVFRDVTDGGVDVEVGVETARPFAATGSVVPGLDLAGPRWEIYSDWTDDESALGTEVVYLVA